MDIPQAQAPTVGTNWFTDVTGEHRGYLALHVVAELRTEE